MTGNHKISKKSKIILILLLIILNIVIRIPSNPHEKGYDSFFIHSLANSISIFGEAKWWINWLSIFGLYPFSYASAVPFILSGISQTILLGMEKTILLYCSILGLLSIFTAYLFARSIYNNFVFGYIMALFFSVAPGVMVFTNWEVSTRGEFIVLYPLYIYILLKKMEFSKKIILLFILFILLLATHHYAYFAIFLSLIFVALKGATKINKIFVFKEIYKQSIFIFLLLILLTFPFFSRSLISTGSRYSWIITAIITNVRYTGPIFILFLGGLIYLIMKKTNFEEIFILSAIISFIPTLYSLTYGPFLLILFTIFLTSVGFNNLLNMSYKYKNKLFILFAISMLIFFVAFSDFYNQFRTGESKSFWQLDETTYSAGIWSKNHIPEGLRGLDTGFETFRLFAISEGHPIMPIEDINSFIYGFINISNVQFIENSPFNIDYYFDGPYVLKGGSLYSGGIEWLRQTGTSLTDLKGFDYFIEDKYDNKLIVNVIHAETNKIYDNTRIAVWKIYP